jgi:hypothetical protein
LLWLEPLGLAASLAKDLQRFDLANACAVPTR